MGEQLRRFVARAPRYVLRTGDNQLLRFANNKVNHRSLTTRFVNVSETGLAFVVDQSQSPKMGEIIKLEFPVPGGEQVAWFGKVTRLEQIFDRPWWAERNAAHKPEDVLVGVQFVDLPDGHRENIRAHLHQRFRDLLQEMRMRKFRIAQNWILDHSWQILVYILASALTVTILYLLAQPNGNYDPKKGTPWGHRFDKVE